MSLESKKRLVFKVFILQDTKWLELLPWSSRKQSSSFISCNSNIVFLNCSILFAKTDPLGCVNLIFLKELKKCFLYFFLKSLFFATLGILSNHLFCWLKWTALCRKSKSSALLTTILPLKQYFKSVYRQSTFASWNRVHPISVAVLQCCELVYCDICNWVGSTSCHRGEQYSILSS